MENPEINLELSHFLNLAVKDLISQGKIGKYLDFACRCDLSENILLNILNHRTKPTHGQFLSMIEIIRDLSPDFAYKNFKRSFLGEI